MAYINAIGTAVPENRLSQEEVLQFMQDQFGLDEEEQIKLRKLYEATAITHRHTVMTDYGRRKGSYEFYPNEDEADFPPVSRRMDMYRQHALPLAESAIQKCLDASGIAPDQVTHLIVVSSTGMYAPGLDIEIIEKLGINPAVERTSILFMGCHASINALKTARYIASGNPEAKVLILCLEMCSIHFRNERSWENMVVNALFGDGAAAVMVQHDPAEKSFRLDHFFSRVFPHGKKDVAWNIADSHFEVKLSAYVPALVKQGIGELTTPLLQHLNLQPNEIDFFAIHPGGKKILQACERSMNITEHDNRYSYSVLRNNGNMSSPTLLFVLHDIWNDMKEADDNKRVLSIAFGPGLALESMLLNTHVAKAEA